GNYAWQAKISEQDWHAAGAFTFTVKVVGAPDHQVTVEAFDGETRAPVKGAHVLMHPYRAHTDENGIARLKVAKGRYKLFVSGFNYMLKETIIDVTDDVTTRADLLPEPEEQVDYR